MFPPELSFPLQGERLVVWLETTRNVLFCFLSSACISACISVLTKVQCIYFRLSFLLSSCFLAFNFIHFILIFIDPPPLQNAIGETRLGLLLWPSALREVASPTRHRHRTSRNQGVIFLQRLWPILILDLHFFHQLIFHSCFPFFCFHLSSFASSCMLFAFNFVLDYSRGLF